MKNIDIKIARRDTLRKELDNLDYEILSALETWQSKALNGYKIKAIHQYYKAMASPSLATAKSDVESFINSASIVDELKEIK